ncbi:MAG TPA: OmpA family protein, partial [Flavobacteriales bacterium]|nr:OmpA family protein [Flavobacteriales bacterium]
KGFIRSLHYLAGLEADIELIDLHDATLIAKFKSDAVTGEYMVAVPAGHEYAMYVKSNGYLIHSENVRVPDGERGMNMSVDVSLGDMETGSHVTMNNIFFASASAELQPNSLAELDQLEQLLRAQASLRLEISGHTDNTGSEELNASLSQARADAVRDHLIRKGITADRLTAVGLGAAQPVAENDTEEHKALNRRTEVKVL